MDKDIIKIFILGLLIIISLFYLYFFKKTTTEGFADSGSIPEDADNPSLTGQMYFGIIPQAASASIYKKKELQDQLGNPDAINVGDNGAEISVSEINLTPDPNDIEAVLNSAVKEGFEDDKKDRNAANAQKLLEKAMDKMPKSKTPKPIKPGKLAKKAKNLAKFGKQALQKAGQAAAKAMEKVAKKLGIKIAQKSAEAGVKAAAFSSNPVTVAFGVALSVIAAVGVILQVVIATQLKGDEGVCDDGWQRLGDFLPSWLVNIPGIGDILPVLSPYLCFRNSCESNEDEDGGLCYPKCKNGYNGIGPVCWANKSESNARNPDKNGCNELNRGWERCRDDGTSLWEDWQCNTSCPGGGPWYNVANCNTRCNGCGCIKVTKMDREYCSDPQRELAHVASKIDQQCWSKCPSSTPYRIPGMPYICSAAEYVGDRGDQKGTSYGRGVGKPKLKMITAKPTPPPPPPPPASSSLFYAEDPKTKFFINFADVGQLTLMSNFYYTNSTKSATANADGTLSYEYITKFTAVIASSEQSCDVLCDIKTVTMDPLTNTITTTGSSTGNDRRFYFAKIQSSQSFMITACTNLNGSAPDVKNPNLTPVSVSIPVSIPGDIKCAAFPISLANCQNSVTLNQMMSMYKGKLGDNKRVKTVDGAQNNGKDVCVVSLTEATYDASTNLENPPLKKIINFNFNQDISTDACGFTLKDMTPGDQTANPTALPDQIVYPSPLPTVQPSTNDEEQVQAQEYQEEQAQEYQEEPEYQEEAEYQEEPEYQEEIDNSNYDETEMEGFNNPLEVCMPKCDSSEMLQKFADAFNSSVNRKDFIVNINKAWPVSQTRCDIQADIYVKASKAVQSQTVRFDLKKDTSTCTFSVTAVGEVGSGTFIQANTPALSKPYNEADYIIKQRILDVQGAMSKLTQSSTNINNYLSGANSTMDSTYSSYGQKMTLGDSPARCTDPALLDSIIQYYNKNNYPKDRKNATKMTMTRILKAGTADRNSCDVLFEYRQEIFTDLYTSTPNVTIGQKTERFRMQDNGNGLFTVASMEVTGSSGLPGLSPRKVVNKVTADMNPSYIGTGCDLKCASPEILKSVKTAYESKSIDGFANYMGGWMAGGWVSALKETFTDGGSSIGNSTLIKANRSIRTAVDTCEYEMIYNRSAIDANGTPSVQSGAVGFFKATFIKDPTTCTYTPNSVVKVNTSVIPSLTDAQATRINYTYA